MLSRSKPWRQCRTAAPAQPHLTPHISITRASDLIVGSAWLACGSRGAFSWQVFKASSQGVCCHAKAEPNTQPDTDVSGGGGSGGTDDINARGHHGDDGGGPVPPAANWQACLAWGLGFYALTLAWIASCMESFEQFMYSKALRIAGAASWKVSIILPVLNEAKCIGTTIKWLRDNLEGGSKVEIIVVDGGSSDRTVAAAKQAGASRVLQSGVKGRAAQMNAGAQAASGDLLVFLHADTQPPVDLVSCVRSQLADPRNVLIGFHVHITDSAGQDMHFLTAHNRHKTWLYPWLLRPFDFMLGLRLMFGDQVLCCRRHDFNQAGGFSAHLPIMEDADLCVRLHHHGPAPVNQHGYQGRGRVRLVTDHAGTTSGRRLEAWGPLWATYVHFRIALAWYLGAPVQHQVDLYRRLYSDAYR